MFNTVVEDLLRSGLHRLAGCQVQVRPFCKATAGVTLWGGQSWRWHEHGGELTASWRNGVAATTVSLASERRRRLLPHNDVGSSQCSVRLDTFQFFRPLQRVGLRLSCRWGSIFLSLPFLRSPLCSLCACVLLGAPFFLRLSGLCLTRLSQCCVEESVSLSGVLVVCVSGRWWESRVAMRWERAVNASLNGASPSLPFTFPPSSGERPSLGLSGSCPVSPVLTIFFHFKSFPSGESFVINNKGSLPCAGHLMNETVVRTFFLFFRQPVHPTSPHSYLTVLT